ncbi:MAG: heavy metal translocating P-type ATPase [Arenicellales bacterium]
MQNISCYHCGLPVSIPGKFVAQANQSNQEFCCAGCLAVASLIQDGGLNRYYDLRDAPGNKPDQSSTTQFNVHDNPSLQKKWVRHHGERATGQLLIEGINCSACIWLIETWLGRLPGITSAEVNYSTHRLNLSWDPIIIQPSEILREIHNIGYSARPYSREAQQNSLDRQRSTLIKQLGVSAALGMQIMVLSVALYAGDWFGIEAGYEQFLKKINLLLTIPLILYSAKPFFTGALRSLRTRSAGMDVSVSLGITLAFLGSAWATIIGHGEVYFDSVAMFVFFLLGARLIELNSRIKASRMMDPLADVVPATASRIVSSDDYGTRTLVPVAELNIGDLVAVKPGEVLPTDGIVMEGISSFEESLLTGEPEPVPRPIGSKVLAGSINVEQAIIVRVTSEPEDTVLSTILRLADQASRGKPGITVFAESVAKWFVLAIVLLAGTVATLGIIQGNNEWLPITIAVLVVTCPCALSLATPLALAAATNGLVKQGVFVTNGNALETLNRADHFMMDKTGTLTSGEIQLEHVRVLGEANQNQILGIAAALEQNSPHPMAVSLTTAAQELSWPAATDVEHVAGNGMHGVINGKLTCIGSLDFVEKWLLAESASGIPADTRKQIEALSQPAILLATATGPLGVFIFRDKIRAGASELMQYLHHSAVTTSLVSGDREAPVNYVADTLSIKEVYANCKPEDKLNILENLIDSGKIVSVVGDGINDTPAMGKAHLAVVLARHVNLLSARADIVITGENLSALVAALKQAQKTYYIIRQNIAWALVYNVCAIPAALAGWVPPWLAGIGMSLSSVIVVLNASRLTSAVDHTHSHP